jgi:hypothetical protein
MDRTPENRDFASENRIGNMKTNVAGGSFFERDCNWMDMIDSHRASISDCESIPLAKEIASRWHVNALDQNAHLQALFYLEKRKILALVSRDTVTIA